MARQNTSRWGTESRGRRIVAGALIGVATLLAIVAAAVEVHNHLDPPREALVAAYERSDTHRALAAFRARQLDRPLSRAVFLGTHNSYNSQAYATLVSYWWPNQKYSITDQLRMDIRALELDVHYTWGALRLCHGNASHMICSPADRPFEDGLREIHDWLARPENRQEVLLIELEEYLEGHDAEAFGLLRHYLGDWMYHPAGGCEPPAEWPTLRELTRAGPAVVVTSKRCYGGEWGQWVFHEFDAPGYPRSEVKNFKGYPDCNFGREFYATHFVGFGEDSVSYGPFYSGPKESGVITAPVLRDLIKCGVNHIALDQVRPDDSRLAAAAEALNERN